METKNLLPSQARKQFEKHYKAEMAKRDAFYLDWYKKLLLEQGMTSDATDDKVVERELIAAYQGKLTASGVDYIPEEEYNATRKHGLFYWNYLHNKVKSIGA